MTGVLRSQVDNFFRLAQQEIYDTYGDVVQFGRKSLGKYGRNTAVTTTEADIIWNQGVEVHTFDNTITHISSANAGDTGVVYIEGMTISGNVFTFATQTATLNGQNKVALTIPLAECTRMRGAPAGEVYAYEDTALTAGKPSDTSKIHNTLVPGDNTSLKAATAIAGTNYFLATQLTASLSRSAGSGSAADIRFKVATLGDTYLGNNEFTAFVDTITNDSPLRLSATEFFIIPPNSLVTVTAQAGSGTVDVKSRFSGFFGDIVTGGKLVDDIKKGFI